MQLHLDMEVRIYAHSSIFSFIPVPKPKIREDRDSLKLGNVFGTPTREKVLSSFVKSTCSSLRNSLREMVSNKVIYPTHPFIHSLRSYETALSEIRTSR